MCVFEFAEENNKSEPISHWEDLVRIILVWCGRQDSNLHAFAEEPKGDVTLVKIGWWKFLLCTVQNVYETVFIKDNWKNV